MGGPNRIKNRKIVSKICVKCGKVLPLDRFYGHKEWASQCFRDAWCKDCAGKHCINKEGAREYMWYNNRAWSDTYWDMAMKKSLYALASDEEYLRLVNQTHLLSSDYVPEDLTDCIHTRKDGRDMQQLRLYAAKALEAFLAEAAEYGYTDVTVTSAYRSYAYQNYLFNFYCEQERASRPNASTEEIESIVLTYSLKAGMSEHQSGLCVDMHNLSQADVSFGDTAEAKWLAENAHRSGGRFNRSARGIPPDRVPAHKFPSPLPVRRSGNAKARTARR